MSERRAIRLFQDVSEEEREARRKRSFNMTKENPENMSYWLPKIEASTTRKDSILQVPETKVVQLDFPTWDWLTSDNYTEESISSFNEFLLQQLSGFLDDKKLFMKSGVFSDKFCFFKTIIDADRNTNVGANFLDIYYNSMILGASNTSEVVFREFIDTKEYRFNIYHGMPLHTEFRVFYDFDEKKAVGVANYWHPEYMEKSLRMADFLIYQASKDEIISEYNNEKKNVISQVEIFMDGCEGLTGSWSIDVMKNGDDYWIIDMARMEVSALVDVMEKL